MSSIGIHGYELMVSQVQGARDEQQDRYIVYSDSEGVLLAVMDGHGGPEVAERCQDSGPEIWTRLSHRDPEQALVAWVADLADLTSEYQEEGCTLSAAYIPVDPLNGVYTAVLGDSPIIVRDGWGIVRSANSHNARQNPWELAQAIERGGIYHGGYLRVDSFGPGLQMTRALGDGWMGPVVSKEPDVNLFELGQQLGDFLCVASDGLFDLSRHTQEEEIKRVADMIADGADALDLATTGDPEDNATVLLLRRDYE